MKTVTRYRMCYDASNHAWLGTLDYKQAEDEPEVLVSASDYDSLQSTYNEAVGALQYLYAALHRSLQGKAVMNADEVIAMAETVLNRL